MRHAFLRFPVPGAAMPSDTFLLVPLACLNQPQHHEQSCQAYFDVCCMPVNNYSLVIHADQAADSVQKSLCTWHFKIRQPLTCFFCVSGDGNCAYRASMVGLIEQAYVKPSAKTLLLCCIPKVLKGVRRWKFANGIVNFQENIKEGVRQLLVCS